MCRYMFYDFTFELTHPLHSSLLSRLSETGWRELQRYKTQQALLPNYGAFMPSLSSSAPYSYNDCMNSKPPYWPARLHKTRNTYSVEFKMFTDPVGVTR